MAIQLPKATDVAQTAPVRAPRVGLSSGPQFDASFVDTLTRQSNARETQRRQAQSEAERDQENYAKTKYQNELNAATIESQARVTETLGENTLDQSRKEGDKLKGRINQITNSLPEKYRQKFSPIGDGYFNKYRSVALPYAASQARKIKQEAYDTRVKDAIDDVALLAGDPQAFDEGLARLAPIVEERARARYGGANGEEMGVSAKDLLDRETRLTYSTTVRQAVELQANQGMVTQASEMAEKYNQMLTPADAKAVISALDKARNKSDSDIAIQLVQAAETNYPEDLLAQENFLRQNVTSTKQYREAVSVIQANVSLKREQNRRQEEQRLAGAYDIADQIIASGDMTVLSELMDMTPDAKKSQVLAYVKSRGDVKESDPQVFKELDNLYSTDPERFMQTDIRAYRGQLSRSDMAYFTRLRDGVRSRDAQNKNSNLNRSDSLVTGIATEFANAKGFTSDEDIARVKQLSRLAMMDIMEQDPSIRPLDLQTRIYRVLQDSALVPAPPRYGWLDPRKYIPDAILPDALEKDPRMVLTEENRLNVNSPLQGQSISQIENNRDQSTGNVVDPSWKAAIMQDLSARGVKASAEIIQQKIDHLRAKGVNLTQPYRGK